MKDHLTAEERRDITAAIERITNALIYSTRKKREGQTEPTKFMGDQLGKATVALVAALPNYELIQEPE